MEGNVKETFLNYCIRNFKKEDSVRGDFTNDAIAAGFPDIRWFRDGLEYMHKRGACAEAISAFRECWCMYRAEMQP